MSTEEKIERLRELRKQSSQPDNQRAIERQHDAGKLTARERIELLVDKGSFQEMDPFVQHQETSFGLADKRPLGDAVVTGWGTVDGRSVFVFAEDFTRFGGSLGAVVADKICKVMAFTFLYPHFHPSPSPTLLFSPSPSLTLTFPNFSLPSPLLLPFLSTLIITFFTLHLSSPTSFPYLP